METDELPKFPIASASQISASPLKMLCPACGFGASGVLAVRASGATHTDCADAPTAVVRTTQTMAFNARPVVILFIMTRKRNNSSAAYRLHQMHDRPAAKDAAVSGQEWPECWRQWELLQASSVPSF